MLLSLLNICNAGDSFISIINIYGGSVNLFSHTLRRLGIECIYIDKNASDEEIDAAFQSNTKPVFGETIANLALTVFDIERFAATADKHKVPLIIDNTFATPILCKPFEFGADIIVYSTSNYMDGHAVQVSAEDKAAMKEFATKCCQLLSIRSLKNYKEISLPGTQG